MRGDAKREPLFDAAESKTLRMRGNSLHGNRETPATSSTGGGEERSDKAHRRTADMHVAGESDGPIVPKKRANKAGPTAAGESVEGRGSTKGNALQTTAGRTQGRKPASRGLWGIREAARRDKKMQFTALLHHVTPELLRASYFELKRQAAPGVDGVTWQEYGSDLEARLADLQERVHRGTYRAKPSKRAWIPKSDGRQRPLGIAALEDKIVQQAVKTVLEQIYEEDFLGYSYGFRPRCGCHDALDALWVGLTERRVNWLLDADIRGLFRRHRPRLADEVPRTPNRGSPDSSLAMQMVARGRVGRRRVVADHGRDTAGGGDFAPGGQRVPARCPQVSRPRRNALRSPQEIRQEFS